MSRIRSKWTHQEKGFHNHLKGLKIKHAMHPKMDGSPDIILKDKKLAIFLQGCFWHKCPKCYKEPATNVKYWLPKIEKNILRDKRNFRLMKKNGWKVMKMWEHETKNNFKKSLERILNG